MDTLQTLIAELGEVTIGYLNAKAVWEIYVPLVKGLYNGDTIEAAALQALQENGLA